MYFVNHKVLTDELGTLIKDYLLFAGVVVKTQPYKVNRNVGFFTLIVKEDNPDENGDVDIYVEYSIDGKDWYRASTTSGGTLTQEANIVTGLKNATKWIVFTARLTNNVRFVFAPDTDSMVTAEFVYQEDQ